MECFVCKRPTKDRRICVKRECLAYVEKLTVGKYVCDRLRAWPAESLCHLQFAFMAFHSTRWRLIAHPFPASYDDVVPIRQHMPIIMRGALDDWVKFLQATPQSTDEALADFMGRDLFTIVKFVLMTAPKLKLVAHFGNATLFALGDSSHPTVLKHPFYHGSSAENWYSIIRNGIKVCSGTKWEMNGRAHGEGVYLSNTLSVSAGYCQNEQNIIGVYKWARTTSGSSVNNIFVAKDPKELELCYLIVYRGQVDETQQMAIVKKIKECA